MEQEKLILKLDDLFKVGRNYEARSEGLIRKGDGPVRRIGVCVDLTENVADVVTEEDIDFLVIHHGNGVKVENTVERLDIGAYKSHLGMYFSANGMIRELSKLYLAPISFERATGEVSATGYMNLSYGGNDIPGAAVLGLLKDETSFDGKNALLTPGQGLRMEFLRNVEDYLRDKSRIEFYEPFGVRMNLNGVTAFPNFFITGSSRDEEAFRYAESLGITPVLIGDYHSALPGSLGVTRSIANVVGEEISISTSPFTNAGGGSYDTQEYQNGGEYLVKFIPNN